MKTFVEEKIPGCHWAYVSGPLTIWTREYVFGQNRLQIWYQNGSKSINHAHDVVPDC